MLQACEKLLRVLLVKDSTKRPNLSILANDTWINHGYSESPIVQPLDEPVGSIDDEIVQAMVTKYKLDANVIVSNVSNGVYDDVAAIYHLMVADKKKKGALETSPSTQVTIEMAPTTLHRPVSAPPQIDPTQPANQLLAVKPLDRIEEEPLEQTKTRPRAATVSSPEDKAVKLAAEHMTGHFAKADTVLASTQPTPDPKLDKHDVKAEKEGRRRNNTYSGHGSATSSEETPLINLAIAQKPSAIPTASAPSTAKYPTVPERSMRFMFTTSNTTTQPPAAVLSQLIQILPRLDTQFTYDGNFLFSCRKKDVCIELEICKVPILKNLVSVHSCS